MQKSTAETIAYMIEKECQRESLTELCESYGVTCDDFEQFIKIAKESFDEEFRTKESKND